MPFSYFVNTCLSRLCFFRKTLTNSTYGNSNQLAENSLVLRIIVVLPHIITLCGAQRVRSLIFFSSLTMRRDVLSRYYIVCYHIVCEDQALAFICYVGPFPQLLRTQARTLTLSTYVSRPLKKKPFSFVFTSFSATCRYAE